MSKKESNAIINAQDLAEEKKFWRLQRNLDIFNLFVQGKGIVSISETLSMKPLTVEGILTNRYFVSKLEKHLRGVIFTNQVSKVIAASDVFNKLWARVTDNIEEIPPEICLKELTKLFPRKKDGLVINPKNLNVFVDSMGNNSPEDIGRKLMELDDDDSDSDLGYVGLEEDDDAEYPELGEGK